MGFKCCVPAGFYSHGCSSGYATYESTGVHKFPTDEMRRGQWLRRIHRADFKPTNYSGVSLKHFVESDFKDHRQDSNICRKRCRGDFVLRSLKEDACPSVFLNKPAYLT